MMIAFRPSRSTISPLTTARQSDFVSRSTTTGRTYCRMWGSPIATWSPRLSIRQKGLDVDDDSPSLKRHGLL